MTTTHKPQALTFKRYPYSTATSYGQSYYTAKTPTRVYDTQRTQDGKRWVLAIWKAETVVGMIIRDEKAPMLARDYFDSKRDAVAVAKAYHALGDDYRDADHGGKSRYTEAVTRAFAQEEA